MGKLTTEIIGSDILYLRPISPDDRSMIYAWRNLPDVAQYMFTDHQIKEDEHNFWFDQALKDQNRKYWIIIYKKEEVGLANVTDIDTGNKRCFYASYIVHEKLRGKGIGALTEYYVLKYLFEELDLNKVSAEVFSFNKPGISVHKSLGFREEGLYRQHRKKNGQFEDVVALAILKSEWDEKKQEIEKKLKIKGLL